MKKELREYARKILADHGCDEFSYGTTSGEQIMSDLKEAYPDGMDHPYIDVLRDEEEEAYENLPESIQESERGETMTDAIGNLEDAISTLEDATSCLSDAKGE
jgi:predicted outer membrane protein